MQGGVLNDSSLWILTDGPKLQPQLRAQESTKFWSKFGAPLALLSAGWLSVHHMHYQIHNHELHISILTLLPGNSQWGAAQRVVPISTPALQSAAARLAQTSSVPFTSSLMQKKLLVYALFDGRGHLLSPDFLIAARLEALVFNNPLFCRQFQRIT